MTPRPDIRRYFRDTDTGDRMIYDIEIRVDEQRYLIRRAGDLLKDGSPGASVNLGANALFALACADIEDLVGMDE